MYALTAVSIGVFLLLGACAGSTDEAIPTDEAGAHYLQASSTITQCPGTEPELVKIDVTDGADGITLENNKITVNEAGTYLVVAAPQVGREDAGPLGCFDLWLRVNGSDVANSNVQLCQDADSMAKDVIISQGILPLEAGDVLEVMMSANNPEANLCIEAIQPSGEPLVPSIIFSMMN